MLIQALVFQCWWSAENKGLPTVPPAVLPAGSAPVAERDYGKYTVFTEKAVPERVDVAARSM